MRHILAFGGGVDSTALLLMHLHREAAAEYLSRELAALDAALPPIDAVVFADPGAEWPETYENAERARLACLLHGTDFVTVRKGDVPGTGRKETITEWVTRLGIVPLMPGGSHICSLKFKGEVMQAWARQHYGHEPIRWSVGIEATETGRVTRFTVKDTSDDGRHSFAYPLVEMGLDRAACERMIEHFGWPPVRKSSCQFCPFMQEWEIERALSEPDSRALLEVVEGRFRVTSFEKHMAWLDEGQPLNKAGRAPAGMWKHNSWANGARLFARSVDGKRLSIQEWAAHFAHPKVDTQLALMFDQ